MPYFRCDRCQTEYYSAAMLSGKPCTAANCHGTLKANPFRDRNVLIDVSKRDDGESDERPA